MRTAIGLLKETRAVMISAIEEMETAKAKLSEMEVTARDILMDLDAEIREAEKDPAMGMPIEFDFVANPDD
jgi:hypothetical protein